MWGRQAAIMHLAFLLVPPDLVSFEGVARDVDEWDGFTLELAAPEALRSCQGGVRSEEAEGIVSKLDEFDCDVVDSDALPFRIIVDHAGEGLSYKEEDYGAGAITLRHARGEGKGVATDAVCLYLPGGRVMVII
eukprot:4549544-Prymnesium_polylepis.1